MALYVNGKQISGGGGGGSTNSVELTYAEYQALTPEQQLDGTEYFITDINGDGQDFQPICYSEEEREIGVWVDGKPLYEKTLVISSLVSGSYQSVSHNIPNLDTVFVKEGFALYIPSGTNNLTSAVLSSYNSTVAGEQFLGAISHTDFGYRCGADLNGATANITIQYTKSTDTAGSGTWTPQGVPAVHYSEDEQVVGTWIDGSTLYEKTLIFNNVQVTQSDSTSGLVHNVSNIGSFKRVTEAYVDFSGGQNWIPAIDTITISTSDYVVKWAVGDTSITLVYKGELSLDASVNRSYLFTIQYTKSST